MPDSSAQLCHRRYMKENGNRYQIGRDQDQWKRADKFVRLVEGVQLEGRWRRGKATGDRDNQVDNAKDIPRRDQVFIFVWSPRIGDRNNGRENTHQHVRQGRRAMQTGLATSPLRTESGRWLRGRGRVGHRSTNVGALHRALAPWSTTARSVSTKPGEDQSVAIGIE
jgi:hypothetical protein